jgi:OmpA-OmpF porin, OOP family
MKLRSALLAATVMVAPVAAKAQVVNGLYIGAGAGVNFLQDQSVKSVSYPNLAGASATPGTAFAGSNVQTDAGFAGVFSIGYGFGNGLRVEGEGGFRQNKFTKATNGAARASAGGDEYKYSAMINVLYDFDLGPSIPVMPYVGLGAGYAWAQHKNARFYGAVPGFASQLRTNDGDGGFAYQAIAGAAFPIAAVPGLALTLEYRFMGMAGDRTYNYQYLASGTPAFPAGVATRAKIKFDDDYNHSIMLGVRYAFNAAPPPVVAPIATPAPTAARTYLVFFDWDRADLTERARQIIAEAAQATTRVQVTRIEVQGHTDTSGTARYNQALSVRRANVVAAELVRLGVPRSAITTQGFGFSRPLVATGPGVREPQNRRVEIILR